MSSKTAADQRKILEEIQSQTKLLKSGTAASLGLPFPTGNNHSYTTPQPGISNFGDLHLTPGQRSAQIILRQANNESFGSFIAQDSQFGNSIIPVLPRYADLTKDPLKTDKLKDLEIHLSDCETFQNPKIKLEQYATSPHVAARMIYTAQDHIKDSLCCDLGSGCGILSIGAVMAGAQHVTSFEIDEEAIELALRNREEIFEDDSDASIDFIQAEISPYNLQHSLSRFKSLFDVVVMNPPFGTKNNCGADYNFLKCASALTRSGGHIYSLHKTSTRPYFYKKLNMSSRMLNTLDLGLERLEISEDGGEGRGGDEGAVEEEEEEELDLNLKGSVLAEVSFEIPNSYKFHKKKSVDVAVDFWHFEKL